MRTALTTDANRTESVIAALMATWANPETDPRSAERCRIQLVMDFAEPLIRSIVRHKMHADPGPAAGQRTDREEQAHDAYGEALIATCRALENWRSGKAQAPDRFLNYVAIIAYRACGRAIDTGRSVAYLLTHQQGFALWSEEAFVQVGGYLDWNREGRAPASSDVLEALRRDPEGFAEEGVRKRSPRKSLRNCNAVERLMALLDQADAPIELGALTIAYHTLERAFPYTLRPVSLSPVGKQGKEIHDMGPEALDAGIDPAADVVDAIGRRQEQQTFLAILWRRIVELPSQQRATLLLGLERSIFLSLVKNGSASFQEIAQALEKTPEEFAQIWQRLPLNDQTIAQEMGLSNARVNDRRQSAYRTLAWHLRPYDRGALRRIWHAVLHLDPPRPAIYLLWARDIYGSSLLSLITRESIARRAELPDRLHIAVSALEGALNHLPLSFEQIAQLLAKTPHEVAYLYMEAYSALLLELTEDDAVSQTMQAVVLDRQQKE